MPCINKPEIVVVVPENIGGHKPDCFRLNEWIKGNTRVSTNRVDRTVWMVDDFEVLLYRVSFVLVVFQHLHILISQQQAVVSVNFDIVLGKPSKISNAQKAVVVPDKTNIEGVHLFGLVVVVQAIRSIIDYKFGQIGGKVATSAVEYVR